MSIRVRSYQGPVDFRKIGQFLTETYQPEMQSGNWLQPRWEYMHYHPYLDESVLYKSGIWEDDGDIVGVAHCEFPLGEVYFEIYPDYGYLKPDMLEYAENHLYARQDDGQGYVTAFISAFDTEFEFIARLRGYEKREDNPDAGSQFMITHPFPVISLPEGYRFKSFQDDNNLVKIHRVLHRGFNHPGEPPEEGIEGRRRMQSAPNYRKDLNIVVEASDGDFASYCGMWYEETNKLAYVEPVATDPDYRGMGLGTAVVLEGIRRCGEQGATVAYVGTTRTFYTSMGFRRVITWYPWTKRFEIPG